MTRFEKRLLWGSTGVVAATGFVYLWMKYALSPAQPWDVVNHPLQPHVLKLHILAAPVMVFAIGMITTRHIWRHFRENVARGRRSGLTAALVVVPMVVTGYLIQAVTHVGWLKGIAYAHIGFSIVFTLGLGAHGVATRAARRSRLRQGRGEPEEPAGGVNHVVRGTAPLAPPQAAALNFAVTGTSIPRAPRHHAHRTGQAAAHRDRRISAARGGRRGRAARTDGADRDPGA